jgi:hypothetical protein
MVKNPYVGVFGQPIEVSLVEGRRAQKEIMVFGVEFRQVESNVESVLTNPGLFSVQVFDCQTNIHNYAANHKSILKLSVQESCTPTVYPATMN